MYQDVQKYLQFLFDIATLKGNTQEDYIDNKNYAFYSKNEQNKDLDFPFIYDQITDFAFLSLLNNSSIDIDDQTLKLMVEQGIFKKTIKKETYEGGLIREKLASKNVKKVGNEMIYKDIFGKEVKVIKDKDYQVEAQRNNVLVSNYYNQTKINPRDIINIIRNNIAHNDYKKIGKEDLPAIYKDTFSNLNETCYLFKDKDENVDVLVCESWLREFKKVYFHSAYFKTNENETSFYFPRYILSNLKRIQDENDLEKILNNTIHTTITIKNLKENYMITRDFIEEHLFNKVYTMDKKLKYKVNKKSPEEIVSIIQTHQEEIKLYLKNELEKQGFTDFEINFSFARDDKNFPLYVEQWKSRFRYDKDFYESVETIDEQLYYLAGSSNLKIDGGFGNKKVRNGLTPAIISLFSTMIESTRIEVPGFEKVNIVQHFIDNLDELKPYELKKISELLRNKSSSTALNIYSYLNNISGRDFSSEERLVVNDYFRHYTADHELSFIVSCASIYNALIATQFTEKTCKKDENNEYPVLLDDVYCSLKEMEMEGFEFKTKDSNEFRTPFGYKDKMYILNQLRNILLHGKYYINYSALAEHIEDTELVFEMENIGLTIKCKANDVMKLCSNPVFYKEKILANKKAKKY